MVLKDDEIITSLVPPRRSFLAKAVGVVAGALAIITTSSAADEKKKRDTQDFIPADNKAKSGRNQNVRSGDLVSK
jgi:hypothetical protein